MLFRSKEKIIDVLDVSDTSALRVGDEVTVWASRDVANHALLLGFGVPFLVLVGVLFLVIYITHNEGLAAFSALLALVPYYAVLFLCRDRIRERLSFHIE